MRNASTEFRDDKSKIYYQIPITLSNGTILDNLENKNIFSGGIEIRDYSSSDSSFDIGGCVMRELILISVGATVAASEGAGSSLP